MTYFQAELNSALIPHVQRRDERLDFPPTTCYFGLYKSTLNEIIARLWIWTFLWALGDAEEMVVAHVNDDQVDATSAAYNLADGPKFVSLIFA